MASQISALPKPLGYVLPTDSATKSFFPEDAESLQIDQKDIVVNSFKKAPKAQPNESKFKTRPQNVSNPAPAPKRFFEQVTPDPTPSLEIEERPFGSSDVSGLQTNMQKQIRQIEIQNLMGESEAYPPDDDNLDDYYEEIADDDEEYQSGLCSVNLLSPA